MIMQAIRHEHPRPRPAVHARPSTGSRAIPGVGMLTNKIGVVPAHPANAQRLLARRGRLALVFPEGQKGIAQALLAALPAAPLRARRLRAHRDARRRADRARSPWSAPRTPCRSSPTCRCSQRLTGLIYFPVNHAFPHFGLAAGADVPAGQVQDPLPRADRPVRATGPTTRRTCRWSRASPRTSGRASRRRSTRSWLRVRPCGSVRVPPRGMTAGREDDAVAGLRWWPLRLGCSSALRRGRLQERARARRRRST